MKKPSAKEIFFSALIAIIAGAATFYIPQFTPALIVAAIVAMLLVFKIFENPFIATTLIAFSLPFERIGSFDIAGATVRASQIFAILMLISWAAYALTKRKGAHARNPLFIFLPIFWALTIFSTINSVNIERSLLVFAFEFFVMIVALIIPDILDSQKKIEKILYIIIISAVVVSIFGIYQFVGDVAGLPTSLTGLREQYTKEIFGFPRVQSTALEPLYFGNFLLIPSSILIGLYLAKENAFKKLSQIKKKNVLTLAMLALVVLNILLTVSRGAYLGLGVVLLLSALVFIKQLLKPSRIFAIVLIGVVASAALVGFIGYNNRGDIDVFAEQITNVSSGAGIVERVESYEDALGFIRRQPFLGVGIGNFGPRIALNPYQIPDQGWQIVNNIYLEIAAERGIPAAVIFICMIIMLILRSIKAYKKTSTKEKKIMLASLTIALIAIFVQYNTFSILYIFHIWFLIGLLVSLQNNALDDSKITQTSQKT